MRFVRDLVDAVRFIYRQQGWRAVLGHLLLPFVEYHHGYILRRRLSEPIEIPFLADPIVVRPATPEDAGLLATIAPRLRVKRFIDKFVNPDGDVLSQTMASIDQEAPGDEKDGEKKARPKTPRHRSSSSSTK